MTASGTAAYTESMKGKQSAGVPAARIAVESLGCKLNQAEAEALARELAEAGYQLVSASDEPDVFVLNTCTVTHVADRKSRQKIQGMRRLSPQAVIVATGCYAQRTPGDLAKLDENIIVVDNNEKGGIRRRLEEQELLGPPAGVTSSGVGFRTRAFVKVQEGCQAFCAYCVVPLVRPEVLSVPAVEVIARVKGLTDQGVREVVLTGTEIGAYADGDNLLEDLIKRVLGETDLPRLRISSLQPQELTDGLLEMWQNRRLCPHFHLSLQSGSAGVLERMGRRYSLEMYSDAIFRIRRELPDAGVTTDIIVGFPGETEAEFRECLEFCQEAAFSRIHVFTYSARPGTAAAAMRGQVSAHAKAERRRQMLEMAAGSDLAFRNISLGQERETLWEQQGGGLWRGLTDNYIRVYCRSRHNLENVLETVTLGSIFRDGIWVERVASG